jgi:hypothetical protein
LEAGELCDAQRTKAGDAKYARVFSFWAKQTENDAASANNGALVAQRRYQCTGELERLDDATRLLERAYRLEPESALIVGNLVAVLTTRVTLGVLRRWIRVDVLRPTKAQADMLLDALLDGPEGERVHQSLREAPGLRRVLELREQQSVLAPAMIEPLRGQLSWYNRLRDDGALARLEKKLAAKTELDYGDGKESWKKWVAGEADRRILEQSETNSIPRLESLRAAVERTNHPPTIAALWSLLADQYDTQYVIDQKEDSARRAIEAAHESMRIWPGLVAQRIEAGVLIRQALHAVAASIPSWAKTWRDEQRRYGLKGVLWHLQKRAASREVTSLRAQAPFRKALVLFEQLPTRALGFTSYVAAQLGNNGSLASASLPQVSDPLAKRTNRIAVQLYPFREDLKLVADFLRER